MWDLQVLECQQQHQLIPAGWAGGTGLPLTFPGEHGAQHSSASGVVPGSSDVEKFIGNVEIGEQQDLQM